MTAGTEIAPDECTRAFLISPPFSRWENGRRVNKEARMIWDIHVHVAGVGRRNTRQLFIAPISAQPGLSPVPAALGSGVKHVEGDGLDDQIGRLIVEPINTSGVDRAVLLAFDAAYREDGTRDDSEP